MKLLILTLCLLVSTSFANHPVMPLPTDKLNVAMTMKSDYVDGIGKFILIFNYTQLVPGHVQFQHDRNKCSGPADQLRCTEIGAHFKNVELKVIRNDLRTDGVLELSIDSKISLIYQARNTGATWTLSLKNPEGDVKLLPLHTEILPELEN